MLKTAETKKPRFPKGINEALKWCPDAESNHGHGDFQSPALPTELSGQRRNVGAYLKGLSEFCQRKNCIFYVFLRALLGTDSDKGEKGGGLELILRIACRGGNAT